VEDGVVFIADAENAGELYALTDDAGHKCRLTFALSAAPDLNAFYEHATATCAAGGAL
jgi:outer membrane usher protein FimD/PapC